MASNQDLLTKVQGALKSITTNDLGSSILARAKQEKFVRTVSQATRILNDARRIDMSSHTHDIDRVGFAERILKPANEGTAGSETSQPDFNTNTLESVEAMAIAGITDSTLEDNIEQEGFEDTLLDLIANRVGIDLEELFLNGDKTNGTGVMGLTDGWLVKSANQVSAVDTETDFDPVDPEDLFDAMVKAVPKKYLRNRSEWNFYVHWDIEDAYRNLLRERGTGLGDSAQTTAQQLAYKGINVVDSSSMPTGQALLAPANNLVYGVYRDVRIEPDRQAKARKTDFVTSLRVDAHYEDENASVVAEGFTG
ncbi:phage major capsid protein [Virgibacillus sp. CBA3643]|uniref:phage major capsid protein n=1 Tax=Virgibacillus sp. CBA3643 TaxID=2942278 RepID=UPI0035A3D602